MPPPSPPAPRRPARALPPRCVLTSPRRRFLIVAHSSRPQSVSRLAEGHPQGTGLDTDEDGRTLPTTGTTNPDHAPVAVKDSAAQRAAGTRLGGVSEEQDRYMRVAEGFTARVDALGEDSWSAPTPCPDWTVRDLVAHVVATHGRVLERLPSETPAVDEPSGDPEAGSEADLVVAWRAERDRVTAAVSDPDRAATPVAGMGGDQPFATLVDTLLCTDTLIHTWDLARAAGLDERLDPDALARARAFMEPLADMMRSPGGFGPPVEPAPGADDQERFLAFCGRAV